MRTVGAFLALALALALTMPACARDGEGTGSAGASAPEAGGARTAEYLPGLEADIRLPDDAGDRTPVVVLIPGGAWRTADRQGLAPLAARLAAWGAVSVNVTMRAASDGVTFPAPLADVRCATAFAAEQGRAAGARGPLVLVGHSSGAHLALLAGLAPQTLADDPCPYPTRWPDAVAGLAGIYDLNQVPGIAGALLGASRSDDPDRWRVASPSTWAAARPELPVLLAHGTADDLVPAWFSQRFAEQLRTAGHPVTLELVRGADHAGLYAAGVVGPVLEAWLADGPAG